MASTSPLKKISVTQAIVAGTFFVNGPVMVLIMAPLLLIGQLVSHGIITPSQKWLVVPAFLCGIGAAWLWWSLTIMRWRIWAFERVADIPALKEAAVLVGLTWPQGHVYERTEIKSKAQAQKERQLDQHSLQLDLYGMDTVVAKQVLTRALDDVRAEGRRIVKINLSQHTFDQLGVAGDAAQYIGIPVTISREIPRGVVEVITGRPQ